MCHYITAVLPKNADVRKLQSLAKPYQRTFEPLNNAHITSQLQENERYFLTTTGQCDCGTIWGKYHHQEHPSRYHKSIQRDLNKFRKKGWSETKIQRWLGEKAKNQEKESRIEQTHIVEDRQCAQTWIAFIDELLTHVPYVGLLLHWYSGFVESERTHISQRKIIHMTEFTVECIFTANEDVLYEFRK